MDRVIVLEELIYEFERTRDRGSFDALRAAVQPLTHATTKAAVLAPESIRAALARTVNSMGVVPWTAIEPNSEDVGEINHAPFLSARADLFSAIRDDLDSDRPSLGVVRRARVRLRDARVRRKYLRRGTDPY